MLKTQMQIEADFYRMVKAHALGKSLRGKLYRGGTRPADAKTEDGVLSFLTGTDSLLQTGTVILNIYVPNKEPRVMDFERIATLQSLIHYFVWENTSDYSIETEQTPFIEQIEDINQTCLVARFRFYRMAR